MSNFRLDLAEAFYYLLIGAVLAVCYACCAGGPLWVAAPLTLVAPIVAGIIIISIMVSIHDRHSIPGRLPKVIALNAAALILVSLPVILNGTSRLCTLLGHEVIGSVFYALRWWSLLVLPIPAAVFILVLRKRERRESAEEIAQT
ncbi:MAG: hypothetical protein PHW53_01975 [Patescibacteria group bacterium]|nr:hypothetical protein [Patescibacteria group bacterium]